MHSMTGHRVMNHILSKDGETSCTGVLRGLEENVFLCVLCLWLGWNGGVAGAGKVDPKEKYEPVQGMIERMHHLL